MPFISKDWRSPGEVWVKTQEGWEKKKILECWSRLKEVEDEDDDQSPKKCRLSDNSALQPHCRITIKCTREIAGFNRLSDALKRLDFKAAVHDTRRFNYICKLLDLLVNDKLTTLSGCAQKVLFNVLEEVAYQVWRSQQNPQVLRKLLLQLETLVNCAVWGRPVGSTTLWQTHLATINRIITLANGLQIEQPEAIPKLADLPEECIRDVLLKLTDHKDLEAASEAWDAMKKLCDEQRIWRELCHFHFSEQQITSIVPGGSPCVSDWKSVYHKLRKTHGLKEDYAEMLQLCRNCRCLFWASYGHPCIVDDPDFGKNTDMDRTSIHIPIPPRVFLKFFSL